MTAPSSSMLAEAGFADPNEPRHVHFSRAEFASRLQRVRGEMAERGIDGLLLFAQESLYWLTGYDTFGFCFFQCLVVPAEGPMTLLTRSADRRQAEFTSILDDIRVWRDAADADPTSDLLGILEEKKLASALLGVETETHGLTAADWRRLESRLAPRAVSVDASDLVSGLRLVKSAAEIAYVRKAAEIADACFDAARPLIKAGADEGAILAAMQGENFKLGGDYPGNEFIIGSGPVAPAAHGATSGALLCRFYSGRRRLEANDQLTLEWAGVWRRYHAALMRTVLIGSPSDAHRRMFDAAQQALLACEAALTTGRSLGDVFRAHAEALDRAGYGHARLNACGYALGARFSPSWMEREMIYDGSTVEIAPGAPLFLHMILMDSDTGAAMCLGRTSLVGETGAEPLSRLPLSLDALTIA